MDRDSIKALQQERNDSRILRAERALKAYTSKPDESDLRDLITDLLHMAEKKNMDPAQQLREAVLNFADETTSRDQSKEFVKISEALYKLKKS